MENIFSDIFRSSVSAGQSNKRCMMFTSIKYPNIPTKLSDKSNSLPKYFLWISQWELGSWPPLYYSMYFSLALSNNTEYAFSKVSRSRVNEERELLLLICELYIWLLLFSSSYKMFLGKIPVPDWGLIQEYTWLYLLILHTPACLLSKFCLNHLRGQSRFAQSRGPLFLCYHCPESTTTYT